MKSKKQNLAVNSGPLGPSPGHHDLWFLLLWLLLMWYLSVLLLTFPRAYMRHWEAIWFWRCGGGSWLFYNCLLSHLLALPLQKWCIRYCGLLLPNTCIMSFSLYVTCGTFGDMQLTQPTLVSLRNMIGTRTFAFISMCEQF